MAHSDQSPPRPVLEILLGVFGARRELPWGSADASGATDLVRCGDRVVPNKIDVDYPGTGGQPALRMELVVVDGVPQCRGLHLVSSEHGRPVRPVDLSAIRLNDWVDDVFAEFAFEAPAGRLGHKVIGGPAGSKQRSTAMAEFQRARRSKEDRAITAERISQAVDVYREHFDDRPIRAVAAAFGVSERTANSWITRARNPPYNFLPKTTRGKKAL